jgi:hypothetical protein
MQTVFTVAEFLFTVLMWGLAIYFTVKIWRELRRLKAAMDARAALERARKSVAEALARVEKTQHRIYMDKLSSESVYTDSPSGDNRP